MCEESAWVCSGAPGLNGAGECRGGEPAQVHSSTCAQDRSRSRDHERGAACTRRPEHQERTRERPVPQPQALAARKVCESQKHSVTRRSVPVRFSGVLEGPPWVPGPSQLERPGLIDNGGQRGCPGTPWTDMAVGSTRDQVDDLLHVVGRAAPGGLKHLVTDHVAAILWAGPGYVAGSVGTADEDSPGMAAEPGGAIVSQDVPGVGGVENP